MNKRLFFFYAFALASCGTSAELRLVPTGVEDPVSADSLGQAAARSGRLLGTAIAYGNLSNNKYTSIASAEFSVFTPENELKWDAVHPGDNQYNFGPGDAIVAFARNNGAKVHGHTLVWHHQLPRYVNDLGTEALRQTMLSHIQTVARHYAGSVVSWDVVNEAIEDGGPGAGGASGLKNTVFLQRLGPGFVAEAFRAAHTADPAAQLYYNDYGCEYNDAKTDRVVNMVKTLLSQGVPIHGVGLQAHYDGTNVPLGALDAVIQRFEELGLKVRLSELDVQMRNFGGQLSDKLNQQATVYGNIASTCLQRPACDGIVLWQFSDAYSWIPDFTGHPEEKPLPWDANLDRKPAYGQLLAALRRGSSPGPSVRGVNIQSTGNKSFCVDINGARSYNGAVASVWECNASGAQQWTYMNGTLQILGRCLDVPNFIQNNGIWVQLWDCSGGANQQWVVDTQKHAIRLAGTQKCLDVSQATFTNGKRLQLYDCNETPAQTWQLTDAPTAASEGSAASVKSVQNASFCLDVTSSSASNGTPVQIYACNGTAGQQIRLVGTELRVLGKCVDVEAMSTENQAKLQLWSCSGGANQQWAFDPASRALRLFGTQKCIDIPWGDVRNGARPQLWGCHNGANQQWRL